jgi:hypothetical protein
VPFPERRRTTCNSGAWGGEFGTKRVYKAQIVKMLVCKAQISTRILTQDSVKLRQRLIAIRKMRMRRHFAKNSKIRILLTFTTRPKLQRQKILYI